MSSFHRAAAVMRVVEFARKRALTVGRPCAVSGLVNIGHVVFSLERVGDGRLVKCPTNPGTGTIG